MLGDGAGVENGIGGGGGGSGSDVLEGLAEMSEAGLGKTGAGPDEGVEEDADMTAGIAQDDERCKSKGKGRQRNGGRGMDDIRKMQSKLTTNAPRG